MREAVGRSKMCGQLFMVLNRFLGIRRCDWLLRPTVTLVS